MIFGADVHDPKGCRKTLYKKSLRCFWAPNIAKYFADLSLIQIKFRNMDFFSVLIMVQLTYILGSRGEENAIKLHK